MGNWLEVSYENYAKIKMRPSTYLTYHGYIENHIKPQLGKIPLNDLTTLHLQQFYKKLLAEGRVERIEAQKQPKGLSAKTVRNIHQIISSALKLAVEQRLIARNPADGCALPKAERKEMQTLPVEQLTSFLREAKDSGVFALYYIDLTAGLRRGELLGLNGRTLIWKKENLRVQRQIGRIDGKIIEMPLKTKNAYPKAISAKYQVGDVVNIPVDNTEFGRIAAGNGKQVIIQGLREAERGMVYDEFNSKQHEILTGVVTRIDSRTGAVSLRIGTGTESTEALLLSGEQVPGEELVEGQHVKVYVVDVRRSTKGPQILISRTHPGLVKRLFELEVPEIYDGTVEVKSIAREAGSRTKMAVWSADENVDPIGACVGPKGQRVANIVEELRGEKIDIIKWSEDPAEFIAAALAPSDVVNVFMAEEGKACRVIVPDDQLSLAIGKEGQNARLAARLTGYKIDIKPESWNGEEEAEVQ